MTLHIRMNSDSSGSSLFKATLPTVFPSLLPLQPLTTSTCLTPTVSNNATEPSPSIDHIHQSTPSLCHPMDNWATPNSTPMPAFTANQQKAFDAAVEARTSRFEAMVSQLTNQVNSMKASAKPARTKPKTQPKPAKKTTTKQPTLKIKLRMAEPSSSRANPNVTPK
ncbi:hypothetical protein H4Q26_002316 [Puccinia striiformis f. sp. tritici PST-130]|nr:hypothetical protein H4Q26_002316 [Puccinia striiformis f. sp. tritici PST-130]